MAIGLYEESNFADYKTVEICGRLCNVQVRRRFHKWNERVWDGRCECAGIVGSSRHNHSEDKAAENAIKDFLIKAEKAGLMTSEEVQQYK